MVIQFVVTTLIVAEFDMVMNSKKVRRPAELQYQFTLGRIDVRDPFFLVPFAELKRKSRARNMQQEAEEAYQSQ